MSRRNSQRVPGSPSKNPLLQGIYFVFPDSRGTLEEKYPLHHACRDGDLARVKELAADCNTILNGRDDQNSTPLHIACAHEFEHDQDLLMFLLQHKANVNAGDKFLETPLHKASLNGCMQCVHTLLHNGADINQVSEIHETCLHMACRGSWFHIAKYLIKKGVNIHERNVCWRTALSHSSERGDLDTVKLLIRKGAKINLPDTDKYCPITRACRKHHVDVAEFLIKKGGVLPDIILHMFCEDPDVCNMLFKRDANINSIDRSGENILHNASWAGNTVLVKLLLDQANFSSIPFMQRFKKLLSGHGRNLRFFAEVNMSVNATDRQKRTALHLACEKGHLDVAKILISYRANVNASDRSWRTPLHMACEAGHTQVAKLLMDYGADALLTDKNNMSPLNLACSLSNLLLFKTLDIELVTALISCGGYLSLRRECDRILLKDMLRRRWPVNRKILYTLLNEKAIWPLPKPGQFVQIPLCKEDLLLSNILNVVHLDPVKFLMLYKFGYEIPGVYNQIKYVEINHPDRFDREKNWEIVMRQINIIKEGVQPLSELCRFIIRHYLGKNVTNKLEKLIVPSTNFSNKACSEMPRCHTAFPLSKRLKEYLMFSELLSDDDLLADRVFLRNKSLKRK